MLKFADDKKYIVGIDLGNTYSQISICDGDGNVESLSLVVGEGEINIPTALCKRKGVNQWFFGNEAIRYQKDQGGIYVDGLLEAAITGEEVLIDETAFDPVALLALFVKRLLGLAIDGESLDQIEAVMYTCEKIDNRILSVLSRVSEQIKLRPGTYFCQSYSESFYNYVINQPDQLWQRKVALWEYSSDRMKVYSLECNQRTKPIVAFTDVYEYAFTPYEPMPEDENQRKEKNERLDRELYNLAEKFFSQELFSSVFLVGNDFKEEWLKNSLKLLCRGRRVFAGSNLFCKGACYGLLTRLGRSEEGKNHVFLGNDKLKANIGMNILVGGRNTYFALLDAGVNWYETKREFEFYIQDGDKLLFIITPLLGGKPKNEVYTLEGLRGQINRMKMFLSMKNEETMKVKIDNLGFMGETLPPLSWEFETKIYG